ncbi:MAG TPA: hypothetical protein VH164_15745 [Ktedonobacteraceae bacterium]|jgi:hypothetical protein|nr:hypothetical protein [Ktedonobacteraceae bacterium]
MVGHPEQKGQAGKQKTGGRVAGTPNILSRRALMELAKLGLDPPHITLVKIGNDMNNPLALRVAALGYAAPYYQPRMVGSARILNPVGRAAANRGSTEVQAFQVIEGGGGAG